MQQCIKIIYDNQRLFILKLFMFPIFYYAIFYDKATFWKQNNVNIGENKYIEQERCMGAIIIFPI